GARTAQPLAATNRQLVQFHVTSRLSDRWLGQINDRDRAMDLGQAMAGTKRPGHMAPVADRIGLNHPAHGCGHCACGIHAADSMACLSIVWCSLARATQLGKSAFSNTA